DAAPWHGRIYRVDVSGPAPVLLNTFDVIPSIAGDNRGGGIWGYGGVAVDPSTGDIYAATRAGANETIDPVRGPYVESHPQPVVAGLLRAASSADFSLRRGAMRHGFRRNAARLSAV